MATFTLAQLKEDVSKKYAPTVIEGAKDTYTLPNFFQMKDEQRKEVQRLMNDLEKDDEDDLDINEAYGAMLIAIVADDKGEALLDEIEDNLALKSEIIESWMDTVQAGEA